MTDRVVDRAEGRRARQRRPRGLIHDYRARIEAELTNICGGILKLLDSNFVPSGSAADSKVFHLKMKGDYHRYLAEFKTGESRKDAVESTHAAYKSAQGVGDGGGIDHWFMTH